MNELIKYCTNFYPLHKQLEIELLNDSVYKFLKPNEFILKEGFTANYACYIVKGVVRSFYIKDGVEITTKFLAEGSLITSIYSFYSRKPGIENIITLEETELICVHYNDMQKLLKQHIDFNVVVRKITEQYLFFSEIEIYNLRKQNVEERYKFFLKHFSNLLQRVPLKYIASYLNMTVETLSRMRNKINK